MSKTKRETTISWLNMQLGAARDPAEHRALENAIATASGFTDSDSPLFTLARTVEACDRILSGDAGAVAEREKLETQRLLPGRTPLNTVTIAAYVRLRRQLEVRVGAKPEWTGPADATIRRTPTLKDYVDARRAAHQSSNCAKRPKTLSLQEMIGRIEPIELRQEIRFALDKGTQARRELDLIRKGLAGNGVDLSPLLDKDADNGSQPGQGAAASSTLSDEERQHLAQIAALFQDNEQLRPFELMHDGNRLKLSRPPSTALLSKARFDALLKAINILTG